MSTVVVIPAYNPSDALVGLVRTLLGQGMTACVVNDGSSVGGGAFAEVQQLGAELLVHPENRGKGAALKTAFRHLLEAGYEGVIVTADADGQHLPGDIERVAQAVREHPDCLVLGERDVSAMPGRSRLGNSVTTWLVAARYGLHVDDTQTGLRGFSSRYLPDALRPAGDRYEYEMSALLRARHVFAGVIDVPIATVYDDGNTSSHFSPVRDSLRILRLVLFAKI